MKPPSVRAMSFATEGFSAMMSFFVTEKQKTAGAGRQRSGRRYAKRRIISGIGKRGKEPRLAESMHLPVLPVRDQLIENQRIDVSAACPEDHQDDDLQLVGTDGLARKRHGTLDDELAQQRRKYLRAFEERYESAALQGQLGRLVRGVSAEGRPCIERFR